MEVVHADLARWASACAVRVAIGRVLRSDLPIHRVRAGRRLSKRDVSPPREPTRWRALPSGRMPATGQTVVAGNPSTRSASGSTRGRLGSREGPTRAVSDSEAKIFGGKGEGIHAGDTRALWRLLACFAGARGLSAPEAGRVPEFGLLIDAGSTGSRLHIYEWPERVFHSIPPPLSHPITSERWTDRMKPGISAFAADPAGAARTRRPFIAWARDELADFKDRWAEFPIWLKATAGMRNLPDGDRARGHGGGARLPLRTTGRACSCCARRARFSRRAVARRRERPRARARAARARRCSRLTRRAPRARARRSRPRA